jgi:hypothetical protein
VWGRHPRCSNIGFVSHKFLTLDFLLSKTFVLKAAQYKNGILL